MNFSLQTFGCTTDLTPTHIENRNQQRTTITSDKELLFEMQEVRSKLRLCWAEPCQVLSQRIGDLSS